MTKITQVNNSKDMMVALNENLHGLLTGQRKPLVVREVNSTLGKMLINVKMELLQNAMSGNRTPIDWFANSNKKFIRGVK